MLGAPDKIPNLGVPKLMCHHYIGQPHYVIDFVINVNNQPI